LAVSADGLPFCVACAAGMLRGSSWLCSLCFQLDCPPQARTVWTALNAENARQVPCVLAEMLSLLTWDTGVLGLLTTKCPCTRADPTPTCAALTTTAPSPLPSPGWTFALPIESTPRCFRALVVVVGHAVVCRGLVCGGCKEGTSEWGRKCVRTFLVEGDTGQRLVC
jgi:hypothetical protein